MEFPSLEPSCTQTTEYSVALQCPFIKSVHREQPQSAHLVQEPVRRQFYKMTHFPICDCLPQTLNFNPQCRLSLPRPTPMSAKLQASIL